MTESEFEKWLQDFLDKDIYLGGEERANIEGGILAARDWILERAKEEQSTVPQMKDGFWIGDDYFIHIKKLGEICK